MNQTITKQPSLCCHKEVEFDNNKTICLKCGRIRIDNGEIYSFYFNHDKYFQRPYYSKTKEMTQ